MQVTFDDATRITSMTRFPLVGNDHPHPIFFTGHASGVVHEWMIESNQINEIRQINAQRGPISMLIAWLPRYIAVMGTSAPNSLTILEGESHYPE